MKNIANIMTASRIMFAITMLFVIPFSAMFWICYVCAGLSDIFDGIVARSLKQESDLGAKLDSIADFVFAGTIAIVAVRYLFLPIWLWVCIALIALVRFAGYVIGYIKYSAFSALHTYANKISGALLFTFPVIYTAFGINASGVFLCVVTGISAIEEAIITSKSQYLNRDCKSIFF